MDGSELVGRHGSEPIREQNAGEKRLVDTLPTGVVHWRESGWDITKSRDGVSQQKSNKNGWLEERWIDYQEKEPHKLKILCLLA